MLKYKWMYIAVLCCAMFAACEPASVTDKNPISFGDRKSASGAVNALLWGYYGETWIYGTKNDGIGQNATVTIVNDESTLVPQDVATRYWAQTESKYDFYAMWPLEGNNHGISNVKYTNGTITFDCDITKQTDICIAATLNQTSQWNVLPNDLRPVNLYFQHMLAKVQFIGKSASSAVEIVSASINVPTTASAVYSNLNGEPNIAYDAKGGVSESLSTPEGFSLTIPESTASENTIDITNGGWLVFSNMELTEDIKFTIEYKTGVINAEGEAETKSVSGKFPTSLSSSWERGKNYIYTFTIQPSGPIIFGDVTVTPWNYVTGTGQDDGITGEFDFPTEP